MKSLKLVFIALFLFFASNSFAQTAWELWFTTGGTQYHGVLLLDETASKGKVRIKFYSTNTNQIENVEQSVVFTVTGKYKRYACHNPTYAGTNISHASYIADNFYFIEDGQGGTHLYNIDDNGTVAKINLTQVKTNSELNRCLIEFGWKEAENEFNR